MDTVKKVYVLVDNETNEFAVTGKEFDGISHLVYSSSYKLLSEDWESHILSGKYRIEEITPLPF